VGAGGSRLGLETGSLANSTRFLVAPLWNVEQRSAVTWVRAFASATAGGQPPPQAHRAATLALMDAHPHPYHWAPYALSTALRGERS
jgi:CHAT domain-containing protein